MLTVYYKLSSLTAQVCEFGIPIFFNLNFIRLNAFELFSALKDFFKFFTALGIKPP